MALVLGRQVGQEIVLTQNGVDIFVKIKSVSGGNVRLEVTAPRNVVVDRKEIYLLKRQPSLNHRIGGKP